jgi:hypothetical protein
MCTSAEALAKMEAAPFVCALVVRSRNTALRSHRAPDAAASTASHPNVRDDGRRPSFGTGWQEYEVDLGETRSEMFFQARLDKWNRLEPAD